MKLNYLLCGTVLSLLAAGFADSHHSAAAFFDLDATVSVEGEVTGARLANPHSYYRITTDEGVDWAWESAGTWTTLAKAGWSGETLPFGTRVRMSGTPAITGRPIARFSTIAAFDDSGEVMILVDVDVFGRGRPDWFIRAQELGRDCENGVNDCVRIDQAGLDMLEAEFGNLGVWSALAD